MLQRENNELKAELKKIIKKMDVFEFVMNDLQERDDKVYRSIFETDPLPLEQRNPTMLGSTKYDRLSHDEAYELLYELKVKMDKLTVQMASQSRSYDTISLLATKKAEMLASIPAIRPLKNMYSISSGFGRRYHPILKTLRPHTGIDITAPRGTPVYATADGYISGETGGSGYGIVVIINHGYSYKSVYAHLSKKAVKAGQKVKRGQIIGYVGNTGLSLGPHLHYEIIKSGSYVNPVHYFFNDITPAEYDAILKSSKEVNQALS